MNRFVKWLIRRLLKRVKHLLKVLPGDDLKELADLINRKVDAPIIDEKAEGAAIYKGLCRLVDGLGELINMLERRGKL